MTIKRKEVSPIRAKKISNGASKFGGFRIYCLKFEKKGKVTNKKWEKGFEEALFYLGNTVYEGMVAGISENEIKIIKNLKLFESNKIKDINRGIKVKGINEYLRRLVDKGILKTIKRGEYVVSDKMLGAYLQRK